MMRSVPFSERDLLGFSGPKNEHLQPDAIASFPIDQFRIEVGALVKTGREFVYASSVDA